MDETGSPNGTISEAPISVALTNLGKYGEGELACEWLALPATTEQVQTAFREIGVDGIRYEEWFMSDYTTEIPELYDCLGEFSNLDELNYLASLLQEMDAEDLEKFGAAVELGENTGSIKDLINLSQNLDCYDLYSAIHDESDLGYYLVEDSGLYSQEQLGVLSQYIDYERFGRDMQINEGGSFVNAGYIHANSNITEYYDGKEVPEEYKITKYPTPRGLEKMERAAALPAKVPPEPCR
jgi:antirestriction protein